ncbi:hypothetical protein Tco_0869303, partial [Tanacetum coccineum]
TATVNTLDNGEREITATIDGHFKTVTIASVRKYLQLADANEAAFIGVDVVHGGDATTVTSIDAGHGSGSMTLHELMVLCTQLSNKVESLETKLKQTKQTYGAAFTKLIIKVKKLEQTIKTSQARRRTKIIASDDEEDLVAEDPSKPGRSMIEEMDLDAEISLVPPHVKVQESTFVSTVSPQRHADTTTNDLTPAEILMEIRKSASKAKGKAKMDETESLRKMKQREQVQISKDAEVAQKLQEEFDAAERHRMVQVHQAAQGFTDAEWDNVLPRTAADDDFVQQLQAGEKCSEEDLPMKLVELVNQRKKFFAQQRAEAKRYKPMTPAQQKEYMSTYIKNQEGGEEQSAEKDKELSEEELQKLLVVVPVEEVYIEALQDLVKERFSTTEPTDDKEKELWLKLKRLFKPDDDDTLWKLQRGLEESLPKMVDDRVKELTKTQVPLYVAEGLILERKHNQADVAKMIAYAIQQDCKNLWAEITLQINNAITNHIPSQVDSSVRSSAIHPSDQDDPHDDAHLEGENNAKSRRHLRMELISLENLHLVKLMKVNQKIYFNVTISTKATPVVQSCQRDPKAPALSLVNQDLLYLKKGNSGLEKFVLSLHKFHAVIFSDEDIEERTSKWTKEPGKPIKKVYSKSKIVQVIKTYGELGHEHKFVTKIIARRANGSLVSITEPDYKNLNKNDIEDMYLLCINGKLGVESYQQKVNLTAPTITFPGIKKHKMFSIVSEPVYGIIYKNNKKEKRVMRHQEIHKFCDATLKRVLEALKSYNNDVKHGYVTPILSKEIAEYLQLFEEEIEERLKHRDQIRH